jgi:uncharacterized protein YdgA (DUF945 family)
METINLDANSGSVIIRGPNQLGQTKEIQLLGISLKSQTQTGPFDLDLGNQNLVLKQIKVAVDGKDSLLLEGITLATLLDEKDSNLNGRVDFAINALKIQNVDFGSGKLSFNIDKLDAKSLKAFADRYNQLVMAMLVQGQAQIAETAASQQQTEGLLPLLLKGTSISIAPLSWKNGKGESTLTLNLDLNVAGQADSPATSMEQLMTRTVKKFDLNLSIPVAMATETFFQTLWQPGGDVKNAQKIAQRQMQELLASQDMLKLTTLKDEVIGVHINYADNQIEFNGKKMSLQAFDKILSSMSSKK